MPALGMAQDTGVIVAWRKAEGDAVAIGDPLFDVETDKTTMEVEAAQAGYLTEIRAAAGADVPVGDVIAIIGEAGEVPTRASSDAGPNFTPATAVKTEPPTSSIAPLAPNSPKPQTPRNKPAVPSTPSAAPTILASPKAKFEAHRRGIDLRRLVEQGVAQPFHVADLDRLQPEAGTATPPAMNQLSAKLDLQVLEAFVSWVEDKTRQQGLRHRVLATFAAAAIRSDEASDLIVSVLSTRGGESAHRNPDRQGLGEPEDSATESGNGSADLALVDLAETRLTDYRPPARSGCPTIVLTRGSENNALATLHFCEKDLSLLAAVSFLDGFAERIEEPAMQLL